MIDDLMGLKTSEEWARIYAPRVLILDPDGWNRADPDSWLEPISRKTFERRLAESTIQIRFKEAE